MIKKSKPTEKKNKTNPYKKQEQKAKETVAIKTTEKSKKQTFMSIFWWISVDKTPTDEISFLIKKKQFFNQIACCFKNSPSLTSPPKKIKKTGLLFFSHIYLFLSLSLVVLVFIFLCVPFFAWKHALSLTIISAISNLTQIYP